MLAFLILGVSLLKSLSHSSLTTYAILPTLVITITAIFAAGQSTGSAEDASSSTPVLRRIDRARALAAAHQLHSAASELANLAVASSATCDELHFVREDSDSSRVTRADSAAAEQAHSQSLHAQTPNVRTDCSIPGSPASMRANSAGASANATVCVISGNRFKRCSYWRRTAVCHSRGLFQR